MTLLAWLPAALAWWRTRNTRWLLAAALLALAVVVFIAVPLENAGESTGSGDVWPGLLVFGIMVGGVISAVLARPLVLTAQPASHRRTVDDSSVVVDHFGVTDEPAVQAVLHRRRRRQAARYIVSNDPAMAHELSIGRPDLHAAYDDGGLVDLNNVTATGLVSSLAWNPNVAEAYVISRDTRGGYTSFDEIAALSGLESDLLSRDAERLIILPYRPQ